MKTVTVSTKFQVVIPEEIRKKIEEKLKNKTVCIIGLGYISSLLAKAFVIETK